MFFSISSLKMTLSIVSKIIDFQYISFTYKKWYNGKKIERREWLWKRWLLALVFAYLVFMPSLVCSRLWYLILSGDLNIHADNTAIFKERQLPTALGDWIIMVQLVELGKAGKMPERIWYWPRSDRSGISKMKLFKMLPSILWRKEDGYKVKNLQCWICWRYWSGNGYLETIKSSTLLV